MGTSPSTTAHAHTHATLVLLHLLTRCTGRLRCLVAPFMSKGQIRFGSKMGVTEMSARMEETHLQRCGIDYYAFARLWLGSFPARPLGAKTDERIDL